MLRSIWRFYGNVRLTFWLLILISCTLAIGSYFIRFSPQVFRPLNSLLFQEWFGAYGEQHASRIWWLWVLFGLLLALAINTIACTTDRLTILWNKRGQMGRGVFFLKITPSLIHICFLVILSGHLLSLVSGMNREIPVIPESENILPRHSSVIVFDQNCDFYSSPDLIKGLLKQCVVSLELRRPGETAFKKLGFLRPFFWHGFSFHLVRDKKADGPGLKIAVKRDPGLKFILSGFTVMVLLMLWYYLRSFLSRTVI